MSHPLVLGLFDTREAAAQAARSLRELGLTPGRVSIVAKTHDEEETLARLADASPGSEIEDSPTGSRLGELGAHFIAAVALVVPGIGPIVAGGPLAAGMGETAGHLLGGLARALEGAGMPAATAGKWEARVRDNGAVVVGAHLKGDNVEDVRNALNLGGAVEVALCNWPDA